AKGDGFAGLIKDVRTKRLLDDKDARQVVGELMLVREADKAIALCDVPGIPSAEDRHVPARDLRRDAAKAQLQIIPLLEQWRDRLRRAFDPAGQNRRCGGQQGANAGDDPIHDFLPETGSFRTSASSLRQGSWLRQSPAYSDAASSLVPCYVPCHCSNVPRCGGQRTGLRRFLRRVRENCF